MNRRLIIYTIICGLAVAFSLSRAALITMLCFIVIYLVQEYLTGRINRLLLVGILGGLIAGTPIFLNMIANFNISSYYARYGIARGALELIAQKPLFGGGLGTQVNVLVTNDSWGLEAQAAGLYLDIDGRDTHSTILQIGVEMGLCGIACSSILVLITLSGLRRIKSSCIDPFVLMNINALYWTFILTGVFCCFDSLLYRKPLWLIIGISSGVYSIRTAQWQQRVINKNRSIG